METVRCQISPIDMAKKLDAIIIDCINIVAELITELDQKWRGESDRNGFYYDKVLKMLIDTNYEIDRTLMDAMDQGVDIKKYINLYVTIKGSIKAPEDYRQRANSCSIGSCLYPNGKICTLSTQIKDDKVHQIVCDLLQSTIDLGCEMENPLKLTH